MTSQHLVNGHVDGTDRRSLQILWNYLTPELLNALSPEQRKVLWLDREFDIDSSYDRERSRELGRVTWGIV